MWHHLIAQQFQQYKTHKYFGPYRKRGSVTFLRCTQIWSTVKETLETKRLYENIKWRLWWLLQGWPQRVLGGETEGKGLTACDFVDLIPQDTFLCGSEGLQNHLIKELISARTLEEKHLKTGRGMGLEMGRCLNSQKTQRRANERPRPILRWVANKQPEIADTHQGSQAPLFRNVPHPTG